MSIRASLLLVLVAVLVGCGGCGEREPRVVVREIEVTGEEDFSALDIEVHLFDQGTRQHLGCSGRDQGLEIVDASDIRYSVDADFEAPDGDTLLADDLRGRPLELIVIEDDVNPCRQPPDQEDDVVGIRDGLDYDTLSLGTLQSFDDVIALRIVFD